MSVGLSLGLCYGLLLSIMTYVLTRFGPLSVPADYNIYSGHPRVVLLYDEIRINDIPIAIVPNWYLDFGHLTETTDQ